MANQEKAKEALQKTSKSVAYTDAFEKAFKKCTHLVLEPQKLLSVVYSQMKKNPKLTSCTIESLVCSVLTCGELGLYPGHGIHLIPYNNYKSNTVECHAQSDYKGVCQLFYRHPDATKIQAFAVDENDDFNFEQGTSEFLSHKPAKVKSGNTVAYYAIAKVKGENIFQVMYPDETRKHGLRYSKQVDKKTNTFYATSLWSTNFDDMSKKTVLLQLCKTLPNVPVEVEKLLEAERVKRVYDDRQNSVFDMPKEEPEIIETEGQIVDEGSEDDKGGEAIPLAKPPVNPPTPKEKVEIEKEVKSTTDKKLDAIEEQKKKDLKFLLALVENKGVKSKLAKDFDSMSIDDQIQLLREITSPELF